MTTIQAVCDYLERYAPTDLAEDWDNVGLILGDPELPCAKVMTCLTITPESASEAIGNGVDLIVSHHPLPFRPVQRITTALTPTKLIWDLARAGVSVYSPHTAFDSATQGINQMLCDRLQLTQTESLIPNKQDPAAPGSGRIGKLDAAMTLAQFADQVKNEFELPRMQFVGEPGQRVQRVATACGSGGSFLEKADLKNADVLVTGEATFHTVLEARARNVGLLLMGHYFSERFAVEALAEHIDGEFPQLETWASRDEASPIHGI